MEADSNIHIPVSTPFSTLQEDQSSQYYSRPLLTDVVNIEYAGYTAVLLYGNNCNSSKCFLGPLPPH